MCTDMLYIDTINHCSMAIVCIHVVIYLLPQPAVQYLIRPAAHIGQPCCHLATVVFPRDCTVEMVQLWYAVSGEARTTRQLM